jgi:hypothetical protein
LDLLYLSVSPRLQTKSPSLATLNTSSIATPTGSGSAAVGAVGTTAQALATPSGAGAAQPSTMANLPYDQTNQSTPFQISVTGANTPSCTTLAPFASISCNTTVFNLSYANILAANTTTPNGFIKINDGFIDSNALTVSKNVITQITNFTGSNATSDEYDYSHPMMTTPFNGKTYMNLMTADGLMSVDSSGAFKVEARTQGVSSTVTGMTPFNSALYYFGSTASGLRLFKLTTGGAVTQLTTTIGCVPKDGHSFMTTPPVVNSAANRLYFVQENASGKCKLHYIDTSDAVYQAADMQGSSNDDAIPLMNAFNGYIWLVATCSTSNAACVAGRYMTYRIDASNNLSLFSTAPNDGYQYLLYSSVVWNSKLYWSISNVLYTIDNMDIMTRVSTSQFGVGFPGVNQTLQPFNGKLYGLCTVAPSGNNKLCSVTPGGVIEAVSNTSGYSTADDSPNILGVLKQGSSDSELYFFAKKSGLFFKLYKVDTAGKVHLVSDQMPGKNDCVLPQGSTGFSLPNGPAGIDEFYLTLMNASGGNKIHKIAPVP